MSQQKSIKLFLREEESLCSLEKEKEGSPLWIRDQNDPDDPEGSEDARCTPPWLITLAVAGVPRWAWCFCSDGFGKWTSKLMHSCGEQNPAGKQQPARGGRTADSPLPRWHTVPTSCPPPSTHKPQLNQRGPPLLTVGRLGTTAIPDQGRNLPLSETICFHLKKQTRKCLPQS